MSDWDDTIPEDENSGRSFGKGRGFAAQRSSENSQSENHRSNLGDERGHDRANRNGGRFSSYNNHRRDGGRFSDDRRQRNHRSDWGSHSKDDDTRSGGDYRGEHRQNRDNESQWGAVNSDTDNDFGENGESVEKPEPVTYVPKEKSEDELFAETGIQKGINFDDYDGIKVKVTGVNIPPPINFFVEAKFQDLITQNLRKCGYDRPTPIQRHAIPIILAGRDLMATAQTGSGKTAAFLLPIIDKLLSEPTHFSGGSCASPQALILSPTRELAIQIYENARVYTSCSNLQVEIVYGGVMPSHQSSRISRGCNILIATPNRLIDFLRRRYVKFDAIQFVVLDEADRMLDMNFLDDIKLIMHHHTMGHHETRQTLMFSATFSTDVQRLAGDFLRHTYLFLVVGIIGAACKDVEQRFVQVSKGEKKSKLISLLDEQGGDVYGTLLFVKTKRTADFIATYLCENDFKTTSIHGDRKQRQREEALNDFKTRKMAILVGTSVAARGLDIRGVEHVINYDLPEEIDEYVHRIGRTGRVGNKGKATSFYDSSVDSSLAYNLVRILKEADQKVPDFVQRDATGAGEWDDDGPVFGAEDYRRFGGFRGDGNQPVGLIDIEDW